MQDHSSVDVPSLGGGGGSAKIGDGGGDFVLFKEESMGEIAGGKMGTTKEGKNQK